MGLVAYSGSYPAGEDKRGVRSKDRRLRAREPRDLLSGQSAAAPVAKAQGCLALGAVVIDTLAVLLPHPPTFNVVGLLAIQGIALIMGVALLAFAGRIPSKVLRAGPPSATVLTTAAVILSGDSSSGFVMLYLWVGLYAFYFPLSKGDVAFNIAFAAANYAFAIAVTPTPASGHINANYSFFVIVAGTILTAGVLLTYLRGRVERLVGRLTDAARTDPLTGMPNRAGFYQMLETELSRGRLGQRPLSLLLFDIDGFKEINRRYGLEMGDSTLQKLGSLLEESVRLIDSVARVGGQEFALLIPEADKHAAFLIAEELLVEVRETFKAPAIPLTASVGIATFPDHGDDAQKLFEHAGDAVQAAKLLGRDRPVVFSPEVTGTLSAAAKVAAGRGSIERQASLASALSLAEALDLRDSYTARHSQTVGRLCELTARELGLPEDRVQRLRLAGLLHDIGKVGVPDVILRKEGPLNDEQWAQMRRHPELGARILSGPGMEDLRDWVLAHHERPDGNGYPKGLREGEIPPEASILAAADAYEAMTSDRVYRPSIGEAAAREELFRAAGTQFDVKAVDALLSAVGKSALQTAH